VGFLFSKKNANSFAFFLENKKDKILVKNLGFYACLGFLSVTHAVNPSFSAKRNPQHLLWVFYFLKRSQIHLRFFLENKKDKILVKNLGFYGCLGFLSGTHAVNPDVSA
jgi:uncharacterized membrane protein